MKIMKKLMMLAAFVALSVPTFSKKYDVFKDVFAEMDQQIASSNRGPLQVTLYRVCTPDAFGNKTECDKASAVYMRRFNGMTGNLDIVQIFKDLNQGVFAFKNPKEALRSIVISEIDKYNPNVAVGFQVTDANGKVCARRDMARYVDESVQNASTSFTVSFTLTPKAEVNELEISDYMGENPHLLNDRDFDATLASLLTNHTLSNPALYRDMHTLPPFEKYYFYKKIQECDKLPKAQRAKLESAIFDAEKSVKGHNSPKVYREARLKLTREMNQTYP